MSACRFAAALLLLPLSSAARAQEVATSRRFDIIATGASPVNLIAERTEVVSLEPPPNVVAERIRVEIVYESASAYVSPFDGTVLAADVHVGWRIPEALLTGTIIDDRIAGFCVGLTCNGDSASAGGLTYIEEFVAPDLPSELLLGVLLEVATDLPSPPASGDFGVQAHGTVRIVFNPTDEKPLQLYQLEPETAFAHLASFDVPSTVLLGSTVGTVSSLTGTASVTQHGSAIVEPLAPGSFISYGDFIETSIDSTVSIEFVDGTAYTVPEQRGIVVERYGYVPPTLQDRVRMGLLEFIYAVNPFATSRQPPKRFEGGKGSIGVRADAGEYLNIAAEIQTGSPMSLVRSFYAPAGPFDIRLDYLFIEPSSTLQVLVNDVLVRTLTYADMAADTSDFQRAIITLDGDTFDRLTPTPLELRLDGPGGSSILIDNVVGPGFANPGLRAGAAPWTPIGDGQVALVASVFGEWCRGTGVFTAAPSVNIRTTPEEFSAADLDADGRADIVARVRFFSGGVFTWSYVAARGNGDGTFLPSIEYPLTRQPLQSGVYDLNADGWPDIFAAELQQDVGTPSEYLGGITVMFGTGDGALGPPVHVGGRNARAAIPADFTGDGIIDIAYFGGTSFSIQVLQGLGAGVFEQLPGAPISPLVKELQAEDLDADGHVDLIGLPLSGSLVAVLYGNGDGTFDPPSTMTAGSLPSGVRVRDLNADALPDVVVANAGSSGSAGLSVFMNQGARVFASESRHNAEKPFAEVVGGDFNGDGHEDLIAVCAPSVPAQSVLYAGDSSGILVASPGPAMRFALCAGEINRDGAIDLVSGSGFSSLALVLLNGCNPIVGCVADYNGSPDPGDILDFLDFIQDFSDCTNLPAPCGQFGNPDVNGDTFVDILDFLDFIEAFSAGC